MSKSISGLFKNIRTIQPTIDTMAKEAEPDFFVGPNGKALPAKLKKWVGVNRREHILKNVKNPMLRNAVDQLYRKGAFIGDGGTASIIKFEKRTGLATGRNGNTHTQKGKEMIRFLTKKVLSQPLSNSERKTTKKLIRKLQKALEE